MRRAWSNSIPCNVQSWWKSSSPRASRTKHCDLPTVWRTRPNGRKPRSPGVKPPNERGQQAKANASDRDRSCSRKAATRPRARAEARLGIVRLGVKDGAEAEKRLKAAIAALGDVVAKNEFLIPSVRNLATLDFPNPDPARFQAMALAEIARLEGGIEKGGRRTHSFEAGDRFTAGLRLPTSTPHARR